MLVVRSLQFLRQCEEGVISEAWEMSARKNISTVDLALLDHHVQVREITRLDWECYQINTNTSCKIFMRLHARSERLPYALRNICCTPLRFSACDVAHPLSCMTTPLSALSFYPCITTLVSTCNSCLVAVHLAASNCFRCVGTLYLAQSLL